LHAVERPAGDAVALGRGRSLAVATLGNIAGGLVFVAILKFAHASQAAAD